MPNADSIMLAIKRIPARVARTAAAVSVIVMACALPAAAQQTLIDQSGNSNLNAINSGDISLSGIVTNPTVSGGIDNSAGNLAAQGASASYSINDANLNAQGEPVGTYTASVSGVNTGGSNSGSVNVRGTFTGGTLAANNTGQSVSATGHSNIISIKTTSK